jgi:hypothetical protein
MSAEISIATVRQFIESLLLKRRNELRAPLATLNSQFERTASGTPAKQTNAICVIELEAQARVSFDALEEALSVSTEITSR